MMTPQKIKSIITGNEDDIAFFIGNGINRHFDDSLQSWRCLLSELWSEYSPKKQSTIPPKISLTELYDIIEILCPPSDSPINQTLQKKVQYLLGKWKPDKKQNMVLDGIKALNAPILTTNFDNLMPQSMNLRFMKTTGIAFSDFYPWACYYSNETLNEPTKGFGIWYVNGMVKYQRSIKLGLSHYMNNVYHVKKKFFPLICKKKSRVDNPNWPGYNTWLNIFFNKSLFIFGLGLEENEVFLRWLLIQRKKHYLKFPHTRKKSWFLTVGIDEKKKFFLQKVGFEVLEAKDYKDIYENLWS